MSGEPDHKRAKTGHDEFVHLFDPLSEEVIALVQHEDMPEEAIGYIRKLCTYTVPGGKMNRGRTVLDALRKLRGDRGVNADEAKLANILGWCVEWLQAFFLVADDLMDNSVTRRGNPCWYKLDDVGLIAVNDALLLESLMYMIIKTHFRSHPAYVDILDVFHETTFRTELGQLLDLTSEKAAKKGGKLDFSLFTEDTHRRIVTYKTAFYTFYLPVACALILDGEKRQEVFKQAREISILMGIYFQVQDDFLDCYGAPEVIGKIGTDIQDFKCSWLAVKCLQLATPQQRAIFEANYGRDSDDAVAAVKKLYGELDLTKHFETFEEDSHKKLQDLIAKVTLINPDVYKDLLAKIFKRKH